LKWSIFALCSKETTTGLQDILALIKDILQYMIEIKREFTDSEAVESIPFILEKASMAKVRKTTVRKAKCAKEACPHNFFVFIIIFGSVS